MTILNDLVDFKLALKINAPLTKEVMDISTKIQNISPDLFNAVVTGVILYRSASKTLNLMIRDSRDYTINCVIWGPQSFVVDWWGKCKVGRIITISCVRVSVSSNAYLPTTTSPFIITTSWDRSKLTFSDNEAIGKLFHLPLKPIELALTLEDVKINGDKGVGQYVDVCVLIRQMKPSRLINLKNGSTKTIREAIVCDKSNSGMLLTIWSEDLTARSESWQPLNDVLHMIDVKIGYSLYYKAIFLMTSFKTVIMDNPQHKVCQDLQQLGRHMSPFDSTNSMREYEGNLPRPEDINTVMTCQRILDRMENENGAGDEDQFTAVVYAILTKFNIDDDRHSIKTKCSFCHSLVVGGCLEDICGDLAFQTGDTTYVDYDIRVDFSDHTGTISNCRLWNTEAELILGCSATTFQSKSWSQRCGLKWRFLMERCRFKIIVCKKTVYRSHSSIRLIQFQLPDHHEIKEKIRFY